MTSNKDLANAYFRYALNCGCTHYTMMGKTKQNILNSTVDLPEHYARHGNLEGFGFGKVTKAALELILLEGPDAACQEVVEGRLSSNVIMPTYHPIHIGEENHMWHDVVRQYEGD